MDPHVHTCIPIHVTVRLHAPTPSNMQKMVCYYYYFCFVYTTLTGPFMTACIPGNLHFSTGDRSSHQCTCAHSVNTHAQHECHHHYYMTQLHPGETQIQMCTPAFLPTSIQYDCMHLWYGNIIMTTTDNRATAEDGFFFFSFSVSFICLLVIIALSH